MLGALYSENKMDTNPLSLCGSSEPAVRETTQNSIADGIIFAFQTPVNYRPRRCESCNSIVHVPFSDTPSPFFPSLSSALRQTMNATR